MDTFSVLDVQKALRDYAKRGHDVVTDPRKLILEGQEYKGVLRHQIHFEPENPKARNLVTYLMQSERPLISSVASSSQHAPQYIHYHEGEIAHTGESRYRISNVMGKVPKGQKASGFWSPFTPSDHPSAHHALMAHNDIDLREIPKDFDHRRALEDLAWPVQPFSGNISVTKSGGGKFKYYTYNPATEELHETDY